MLLLHVGFSSTAVLAAGMREWLMPLAGDAHNSCGVLAGSFSSRTQHVASLPLMVATARVCPFDPGEVLWQTSTL